MSIVLLGLAVGLNVAANALFKSAAVIPEFTMRKGSLIAIGLFIGLLNTLCYIKALEKIPLNQAYPLFSAASIVLIALVSVFAFSEGFSLTKVVGLTTICAGIVILGRA